MEITAVQRPPPLLPHLQEQKKRGVIAASAGNHALALTYHGYLLNVPVTVVTPETAPIMKASPLTSSEGCPGTYSLRRAIRTLAAGIVK